MKLARLSAFYVAASLVIVLPAFAADKTPPTKPVVSDDGDYTSSFTSLHAKWTSSDPESGLAKYRYQIREGSTSGRKIVDWTSAGLATEITLNGLSLRNGKAYFIGVKAINREGKQSEAGYSDGITVHTDTPPSPPPPAAPPPSPPDEPPSGILEGFGSQTSGGAGKPTVFVSNLNDSGPGSLRAALSGGNRTIQFSVAGAITAGSALRVMGANITIDGCSAPWPGIDIIGRPLEMRGNFGSHDIIVQCIRSRNSLGDGITISEGAYNIVLDQVSVANSGDGAIDIGSWNGQHTHDVTVQRSIITQANKAMLIKYVDTKRVTLHHNLFVDSADRSPRIAYNQSHGSPANEITVDLRNNLIANWRGGLGTDVSCGAKANIVRNYYSNPGYSVNDQRQAIVVYDADFTCLRGFAYVQGNLSGDVADIDNSPFIRVPKETIPFATAPITEQDACSAAQTVLAKAGHPIRDAIDQAAVSRVRINC
ncbi:MAG: hypothetical protein ACREQ2_20860 [Candidatus Binatia bacterium]